MSDEQTLIELVKNSQVNRNIIYTRITHPFTGKKLPQRTFFVLLRKYATQFLIQGAEPRMIGLAGLRGTGKTTLMWQIAEEIFNKKYRVYFFNVNSIIQSGYNLHIVLEAFQKYILQKRFREYTNPIVLLFDEVHDDKDWAKTLKILYDEARTAFIICTGSSALLLNQTADLARRMKIEKIYPFKFNEFIRAKSFFESNKQILPEKDVSNDLKNILFYSDNIISLQENLKNVSLKIKKYLLNIEKQIIKNNNKIDLVEEYIKYHNIPGYILYKEKIPILESILSLFERIIYEDVPKFNSKILIFGEKIKKLLNQLAISDVINVDSISQKTGIKKDELDLILDLLNKAEVLNVLNVYGGAESRIWKNKKAFFMSPSLRLALLSQIYNLNIPEMYESKLYEDIVIMYLRKTLNSNIFFSFKQENKNPDFIIETMDKPIALEVGKGKTNTSQLLNIDARYGILVTNGITDYVIKNNNLLLPLNWFLLL